MLYEVITLAAHTGKAAEQIARDTERDYHMSGAEAQEYGLIDRVVQRREVRSPGAGGAGSGGSKSDGGKHA